jgi:membrane-bound lytic murein transglycosylase D
LEISKRYDAIFKNIFRQAGLPYDLAYLPHVESSFQAYARSSAGAVGIWQFTKPAARIYLNNHPALDERLDPVASARGAARYLRDAYDTLGDWPLAVTSYNHGISGMTRAKQYFGTDFMKIVRYYEHPAFGFASRNFYAEFLAAREIANQPNRFFPDLRYEAPLNWDRVVLNQSALASELAFHYDVDKQQLITMNPAWTEAAVLDKMTLPQGSEVWLPPGTLTRLAQLQQTPESTLALVYKKTSEQ